MHSYLNALLLIFVNIIRPDFFLLVDLRDFSSDLGSGGRKKINEKALKMTS